MQKLLQISLAENLLDKIKRVAKIKGLNTSAFVKSLLVKEIQKEDDCFITENGFRKLQEDKIIDSVMTTRSKKDKGFIQSGNVEEFLTELAV